MDRNCLCNLTAREAKSVYRLAHRLSRETLVEDTVALQVPNGLPLEEKAVHLWLFSVLGAVLGACVEGEDFAGVDEHTGCASSDAAASILSGYRFSNDDWDRVDERLGRAIDELPLRHRIVFLLWSSEGLSTCQIASVVGAEEPVVRSRLTPRDHGRRNAAGRSRDGMARPARAGCRRRLV